MKTTYKLNEYHFLVIKNYADVLGVDLFEKCGGRFVKVGPTETYDNLETIDFEYNIKNAILIKNFN